MTEEEWRKIPGFDPRYEVSNLGRVKGARGRVLKLKFCPKGYASFCVADGNGGSANVSVARSVCAAFNGPAPDGNDVDHINRMRGDNVPENLRWGTRSENLKNHVHSSGSSHVQSKLTLENVGIIRNTPFERGNDRKMAVRFGVSRETVRDVRLGKQWRCA